MKRNKISRQIQKYISLKTKRYILIFFNQKVKIKIIIPIKLINNFKNLNKTK